MSALHDEDRPAYDAEPPQPKLRVVDDAPHFAVMWESVLFDDELTNNAKVIYCILQRMAQTGQGKALAPSHREIGQRANVKDRHTVAACLDALEARGHIKRTTRGAGHTDTITLVQPVPKARRGGEKSTTPGEKSTRGVVEKPPGGGEKTTTLYIGTRERESIPNGTDTPYSLFASLCDEAGLDAGAFSKRDLAKHLAIAKRLLEADHPLTDDDVRGVTRWLRSQRWRSSPVTMFDVDRRLSEWRAAGRPVAGENRTPATPGRRDASGRLQVEL